ncbi:MAG TPA: hypothetical protein VIE15_04735 [Acidimicrobiales bacterium]
MAGIQFATSCLTAHLCVVTGYSNRSVGDVVAVRSGVPGHVSLVPGTQSVASVSCPTAAGCIGLERPGNDVGTGFVTINAAGVVTHTVRVATPSGVNLLRIACSSLRYCEVAGDDVFVSPAALEVGTWNGTRLALHRVASVPKATNTIVEGVSCVATTCVVVGYANHLPTNVGFILSVTGGSRFKLRTVAGDSLYDVSCANQARCFAVGFNSTGGVVVALTGGVATSVAATPPDLFGIACVGFACTAVGQQLPPPPSSDSFWGVVLAVTGGRVGTPQLVSQSGGFNDVARVGSAYTAIGTSHGIGSVVTAG